MKKQILILLTLFSTHLTLNAQTNFPMGTFITDLQSFPFPSGQWRALDPANNSLGTYAYQGINFGFDENNYSSLVNPISLNELYFGRWDYGWKGWNRIWHSGNLNNVNSDFTAKTLTSKNLLTDKLGIGVESSDATVNLFQSYSPTVIKGLKMFYQGSWNTPNYASNFRFIDIAGTEEGLIFQLNAYGAGIGYNPPAYGSADRLYINGNVGIGTTHPNAKLTVAGNIHSREVKVSVDAGADFVFEENYPLTSLNSLEHYISKNKHLPQIASAKDMQRDGINLSEMNIQLLKKVEELTLHLINQDKKITKVEAANRELKTLNQKLMELQSRLNKLENKDTR